MHKMMKRLALIALFLIPASSLFSQEYPLAAGSPHGIFIFLSNRFPSNGYIQVARSTGNKNRQDLIATIEMPKNLDDLTDRIQTYEALFSDLGHYSDSDIRKMWDFMQVNTVIDTLPPVNYPVMLLAAGTAYLDQDAEPGVKYTYTITYYRSGKISDTKKTNTVSLPPETNLPVPVYHSKNADTRKIYIDWQVDENPYLYSFRVYRRQNMAGDFEKVNVERGFYNKGDSLFLVMNDRTTSPRTVYEYYIEPLDRLANAGKPSSTVVVSGFSRNDIPVIRRFDVSKGSEDHAIRLFWKFINRDLVRSISIYRSEIYDSAYTKIAEVPPADSVFIDHVPGAMENYYYYLVLQGIMNKSYPSARVGGHAVNLSPPAPPAQVAAVPVDGGVKIFWKHENPVVTGYYIYRDQGYNDSLRQASGLIPASMELMSYIDSSSSLDGNHVYHYAVAAVNDGYQLSDLSAVVAARPGKTTGVISPSNLHGGYIDEHVMLVWDDMNPQDEYLAGYHVYRKTPTTSFERIDKDLILFNTNTFSDTTVTPGTEYDYAVASLDESGSESPLSSSLNVKVPGHPDRPEPVFNLRLIRGSGAIILTWPPESADSTSTIRIFRYEPGGQPAQIGEVGGDSFSYQDQTVVKGRLYFYFLLVADQKGNLSVAGNKAEMRY